MLHLAFDLKNTLSSKQKLGIKIVTANISPIYNSPIFSLLTNINLVLTSFKNPPSASWGWSRIALVAQSVPQVTAVSSRKMGKLLSTPKSAKERKTRPRCNPQKVKNVASATVSQCEPHPQAILGFLVLYKITRTICHFPLGTYTRSSGPYYPANGQPRTNSWIKKNDSVAH